MKAKTLYILLMTVSLNIYSQNTHLLDTLYKIERQYVHQINQINILERTIDQQHRTISIHRNKSQLYQQQLASLNTIIDQQNAQAQIARANKKKKFWTGMGVGSAITIIAVILVR